MAFFGAAAAAAGAAAAGAAAALLAAYLIAVGDILAPAGVDVLGILYLIILFLRVNAKRIV